MACCDDGINAREMNWTGDVYSYANVIENGEEVKNYTLVISGLRSKQLNPLRSYGKENVQIDQEVSTLNQSWVVRNTSVTSAITPDKMIYKVGNVNHHIKVVRNYKGGKRFYVLDTIQFNNDPVVIS